MADPLTPEQQQKLDYFVHDEVIVVYIGIDKYDAVWYHNTEGQSVQVMENLETSLDEC